MSWTRGRDRIVELLAAGELELVTPDVAVAHRLLHDAIRHIESAAAATHLEDLSGGYQLAYDALRKSAAALLAAQGLRATSRGGHVAVQEAVQAQFGGPGSPFRSFSRIRRNRNALEYPDGDSVAPHVDDVRDAVEVAERAAQAARAVLDSGQLEAWR